MYIIKGYVKMLQCNVAACVCYTEQQARDYWENRKDKIKENIIVPASHVENWVLEKVTYVVTEEKITHSAERGTRFHKWEYPFGTQKSARKKVEYLKFKRPHGTSDIRIVCKHEVIEELQGNF